MQNITIRPERDADIEAIRAVVEAAFANHPHSDQSEGRIVDALRTAGALTVSMVAVNADTIVGHSSFSPITIGGAAVDWYGLAPVSVLPAHQNAGIGSALIRDGLARIQALGAQGCVVLGEPAYYERFGFKLDAAHCPDGLPPEYFQVLPFGPSIPEGKAAYHAALSA